MQEVRVERIIDAPPETVFARYTDHAGWSDWAGVGRVRLAREGSPQRDGVGAVREFTKALGLREEVVLFEPPSRMKYRVVRGGFPLKDHAGEVVFEPHQGGTRVVWRAQFGSKVPGTGKAIQRFIQKMFDVLLTRFATRGMGAG